MTESNDNLFIKGFNQGYLLAEYEPQFLLTLLKGIKPINSYIIGLSVGHKEFEIEKTSNQINALKQIRLNKIRNNDLEI